MCENNCKFCRTTDNIISEEHETSTGRMTFADLRFDSENNELDIEYGLLDEDGSSGKDTTWSNSSFKINFCPVCGRKLNMNALTLEQKQGVLEVLTTVKEIEKEYDSPNSRTLEDIEKCYTDNYILRVWESEGKYIEETGEGWNTFEDFLIDFISQNIEMGD